MLAVYVQAAASPRVRESDAMTCARIRRRCGSRARRPNLFSCSRFGAQVIAVCSREKNSGRNRCRATMALLSGNSSRTAAETQRRDRDNASVSTTGSCRFTITIHGSRFTDSSSPLFDRIRPHDRSTSEEEAPKASQTSPPQPEKPLGTWRREVFVITMRRQTKREATDRSHRVLSSAASGLMHFSRSFRRPSCVCDVPIYEGVSAESRPEHPRRAPDGTAVSGARVPLALIAALYARSTRLSSTCADLLQGLAFPPLGGCNPLVGEWGTRTGASSGAGPVAEALNAGRFRREGWCAGIIIGEECGAAEDFIGSFSTARRPRSGLAHRARPVRGEIAAPRLEIVGGTSRLYTASSGPGSRRRWRRSSGFHAGCRARSAVLSDVLSLDLPAGTAVLGRRHGLVFGETGTLGDVMGMGIFVIQRHRNASSLPDQRGASCPSRWCCGGFGACWLRLRRIFLPTLLGRFQPPLAVDRGPPRQRHRTT